MIDIQLVRNDIDGVKKALARKHVDPADVDRLADADRRYRELSGKRDELRGRKNELSRQFGQAKRNKDDAAADHLRAESQRLDDEERRLETKTDVAQAERHDLLLRIPNVPADDVPDGDSDADNVVVRTIGYDP